MSNGNLSWNSAVSDDLIADGTTVSFEVVGFERATTRSGAPMANLTLKCINPADGKAVNVQDRLVLTRVCEWRICQFFLCVGLRKQGEVGVPKWGSVLGSKGFAHIGVESNEYGKKNVVKWYLESAPANPPPTEESASAEDDDNIPF